MMLLWIALVGAVDIAVEDQTIDEASGLESRTRGGFWMLEDSGNRPELFAVGPHGEDLGSARIRDVTNRDWEDLSAYRDENGRRMLLIADTGDNDDQYDETYLIAVPEDQVEQSLFMGPLSAEHVWHVRLPSGPHDVEAVAVEPGSRDVYLLTKRETPPVLWRFSLDTGTEAERVGTVPIPPPTPEQLAADSLYGASASLPTAMDFTEDGAELIIQTYTDAWRVQRDPSGQLDLSHLVHLPVLKLHQTESACMGPDGLWWTTSENLPAPLVGVPLSTPPQR